jgi:hypothetical protein
MIKGVSAAEWVLVEEFLKAHGADSPKKLDLIVIAKKKPASLSPAQCKVIYDSFYAEYLELKP